MGENSNQVDFRLRTEATTDATAVNSVILTFQRRCSRLPHSPTADRYQAIEDQVIEDRLPWHLNAFFVELTGAPPVSWQPLTPTCTCCTCARVGAYQASNYTSLTCAAWEAICLLRCPDEAPSCVVASVSLLQAAANTDVNVFAPLPHGD